MLIKQTKIEKIQLKSSSKKAKQFKFGNRKFIKRILNKIDIVDDVDTLTKLRYQLGKRFMYLPLVNRLYLKHFVNLQKIEKPKVKEIELFIGNRSSLIYPALIDISLFVYNGKKFLPLTILKNFVGHKFGEFVLTRNFKGHKKKNKPTGIKKKTKITKYTQFFENCLYLPNILKQKINFVKDYMDNMDLKRKTIKKVLRFVPNYPFNYWSKWRRYNKTFFISSFKKLVPLEHGVRSLLNKKYQIYKIKKSEFYTNFKKKYKFRNCLRLHFKKFSLHLKKKRKSMTQNTFYKKYIFKKRISFTHKF